MGYKEVIEKLELYNAWRRGEIDDYPVDPADIGVVIDSAIKLLRECDEKTN